MGRAYQDAISSHCDGPNCRMPCFDPVTYSEDRRATFCSVLCLYRHLSKLVSTGHPSLQSVEMQSVEES